MTLLRSILLASASKARYQILKQIGLDVKLVSSPHQEADLGVSKVKSLKEVLDSTQVLAQQKVEAVKDRIQVKEDKTNLILGADTVVFCQGYILGKPRDAEEAEFMLNLLSNKLQYIITGITLLDTSKNRRETGVEVSKAKLKKLNSAEIKGYINSKEYEGKAGGVCIQGKGAIFVKYIEGCYYNIVGLPLFKFYQLLQKLDYSLF